MTPLDDTERRNWQLWASMALNELLAGALNTELPILAWKISTLGLVGEVPDSYGKRNDEADYRAWVVHLRATAERSTTTADGVLHQRASTTYRMRRGMCVQVTIAAKIQGLVFRETA